MRPPKVAWFDWSEDAFRKAQAGDKPVLLFIAAPWCHGCRVMDESTFGDDEVAALLDRDYVPVRVDSDRRPDIDDRYNMGGWPSTAFLTPAGELMGGITFAGRDQMKQLLVQLKTGYAAHKGKIAEEIARRDRKIAKVLEPGNSRPATLSMEVFRKTVRGIVAFFDPLHAGFGRAPKFPMISSLRVILQALQETGGPDFEQVLLRTLDAMGDRGMFDAVEGGFFHYVTNDVWTSPRFEKMAEDNAGLIRVYLDAAVVSGKEKYAERARAALGWARARLLEPARGVFHGSQAADEEYYLLGADGRAKREPPPVDRTIYVTASAAMASAFLRAAEVWGEESFAETALRGLDWVLRECVRGDEVAHYHDGVPEVWTLARDRTALGSALLDAYDHTGETRYRGAAEEITASLAEKFWSAREGGIVDRLADPADRGDLARPRRNIDENALAAQNLLRLWAHRMGDHHRGWAERILASFPDFQDEYGHLTAGYAIAADWLVRPPNDVQSGPGALRPFLPRRVVRHGGA